MSSSGKSNLQSQLGLDSIGAFPGWTLMGCIAVGRRLDRRGTWRGRATGTTDASTGGRKVVEVLCPLVYWIRSVVVRAQDGQYPSDRWRLTEGVVGRLAMRVERA